VRTVSCGPTFSGCTKATSLWNLQDDDYRHKLNQASAAVEAARAAIENNRRQRELQGRADRQKRLPVSIKQRRKSPQLKLAGRR